MPLSDSEWQFLSNTYNGWVDDVAEILASLADAAQDAERSVEDSPIARRVVFNLRTRIKAAISEIADRLNDLTVMVTRLQGDDLGSPVLAGPRLPPWPCPGFESGSCALESPVG